MNNSFIPTVLLTTPAEDAAYLQALRLAVIGSIVLLVMVALLAIVLEVMRFRTRRGSQRKFLRTLTVPVYIVAALVLVFTIYCGNRLSNTVNAQMGGTTGSTESTHSIDSTGSTGSGDSSAATQPPTTTVPPTTPEPSFSVAPHKTNKSDPANWNVKWEIIQNEVINNTYQRPVGIHFGQASAYFALPGVAGFRGDNYRTGSTYGTANVTSKTLDAIWEREISSLTKGSGSGSWTGAGWTGQPLVVQWDEETKAIMTSMYPAKQAKKGLVEVIYATLDGHIYFYDLETGEYTRDPMNIGMTFKGSGSLDPRGYPIMYVGSGDRTAARKEPRMYIINLIDCTIMYERGHDETLNLRRWRAFDSSPLVDAETDTLIWPGESGLLYTIKLNTTYNKSAGTLSINPDAPVMNRYMTDLNKDDPNNNLGFEDSAIIVEHYLYVGDNRGLFFCVDLNTMGLVWAQCINDDLNASPVFEWGDDNQGYLYLATSMEYAEGRTYMYKLNATTGEIVWEKMLTDVGFDKNVSGGALSTPLLGKEGTELEGLVIFNIARTPTFGSGTMFALNTETGEEVWTKTFDHYCWSSPAAVYDEDGETYIVQFDSGGYAHLLEGTTGKTLNKISVGLNVEASPVIFNDMIVVGTRGQKVYGIKIS